MSYHYIKKDEVKFIYDFKGNTYPYLGFNSYINEEKIN